MAFDTYMQFLDSAGGWVPGESQVVINTSNETTLGKDIKAGFVFEIDDFSFDIEQVLNIGSQSSGIGSGKVTFNPFQITRKSDRASPLLFTMCCTGEHFQQVSLYLRRAGGQGGMAGASSAASGMTFLRFDFALVGVKTISWSGADGDEACKEEVTFEYGALQVRYVQQDVTGKAMTTANALPVGSWNRVNNNSNFPQSKVLTAS
jgi:type VI secretion system secreted protein Hcp